MGSPIFVEKALSLLDVYHKKAPQKINVSYFNLMGDRKQNKEPAKVLISIHMLKIFCLNAIFCDRPTLSYHTYNLTDFESSLVERDLSK
jgi:hypothetical protein